LDEEDTQSEPASSADETAMWFKKLEEPEPVSTPQAEPADDIPAWLKGIEEEQAHVAEAAVPASEADESDWMNAIEEDVAAPEPVAQEEDIPSWLKGMDEESKIASSSPQDDLPAWMRDESGEVVAEPTKIERTRPTDWHPIEEKQPEPPAPQPVEQSKPEPVAPVQEKPKPAPVKKAAPKPVEAKPVTPPYREPLTQRGTGMLTMPTDPILGSARIELSRSNIPGALETYSKLIKKGRFLDEVIFDLREALYRYPVEVSIWQSLGDAYMRANRLQDALDAYTKAEELLR
jgi:tetratricopeptide (TPR) repeat protein